MNKLVKNAAPTILSDSLQIKVIGLESLHSVSAIHLLSFPDSAITKLGSEAIRRYYEWQLLGPHETVALGAFWQSKLVGFFIGGHLNGALSGYVYKNRWYLAWRVATRPWLLFNPLFRSRLCRGAKSLRRFTIGKQQTAARQSESPPTSSFGILAIAVSPDCQSRGAGKRLMAEGERRAAALGDDEMHLTVNPQNKQAIQFYERLGWIKVPNDERWRGRMQKEICPQTEDRAEGVRAAEM